MLSRSVPIHPLRLKQLKTLSPAVPKPQHVGGLNALMAILSTKNVVLST